MPNSGTLIAQKTSDPDRINVISITTYCDTTHIYAVRPWAFNTTLSGDINMGGAIRILKIDDGSNRSTVNIFKVNSDGNYTFSQQMGSSQKDHQIHVWRLD